MKIPRSQGFTLIEILLVVVILLILAAIAVPNFAGRGEKARKDAARVDIEATLPAALGLFELDNGIYPTTDQGLIALLQKPAISPVSENWSGPYLKKKIIPKDPWGREYKYVSPGIRNTEDFDLSSLGPDGVESDDDITNWADSE